MSYYGSDRNNGSHTELKHWKYIKRVRGKNGKWRYYYDEKLADGPNKETTFMMPGFKNGKLTKNATKVTYKNGKNWTDKKSEIGGDLNKNTPTSIILERGRLSQIRAKGEKWVYDTFLKKKSKKK